MNGILTQFRIEALHNLKTINVRMRDNKLVIVGENGTGKSTVANFIYYFITRQWSRMANYEFKKIVAVLDNQELVIERDEISKIDPSYLRKFPNRVNREIEILVREASISLDELLANRDKALRLAHDIGIPYSMLMEYLQLAETTTSDNVRRVDDIVSKAFNFQILYLPTYRRIEQDLQSIFPEIGADVREKIRENFSRRARRSGYTELVEFGMADVEASIQNRMSQVKDNVRNGFSALAGSYLNDVIEGAFRSTDLFASLGEIIEAPENSSSRSQSDKDHPTVDDILRRIPKDILTEDTKKRLRAIITKIKTSGEIADDDKVAVHFSTLLIDLYKSQRQEEKDIRDFVELCNQYLHVSDKIMVYDDLDYQVQVQQTNVSGDTKKIKMKMLSSGEKQIISLFSHMFFSGQSGYFVVMDEPELSLSVPWQRRFLPDIFGTSRCTGLIAVTHSPFIFENEFDQYTHSLEEFVENTNVVR